MGTTTNLRRHEVRCDQEAVDNATQTTLAPFAQGATYSPGKLRMLMLKHIAICHRPFSLYTDKPLLQIIKMFRPDAVVVSDTTVSRDIKSVYNIGKAAVIEKLKVNTIHSVPKP